MYIYLYLNIFTILFPFLLSFDKKVAFYKSWPALFPAILLNAVLLLSGICFFTEAGIWGFNEEYLCGVYLFNMPLEEILFFITVPYACVFIYEVLNAYIANDYLQPYAKIITYSLIVILALVAVFNLNRLYTSITFFLLIGMCLFHLRLFGTKYLGRFYSMYLVHLIPFLIVNGVLTYLPIVWYSDKYNLGLRIVSIPVEDAMYSMLMLLLTITVYERLRQSKSVEKQETVVLKQV